MKTFGLEEAEILGNYFLLHPLIKKVEIFGSLSRNSFGHDFDLILIVSEKISNRFFTYTLLYIKFYSILQKILKAFYFLRIMHPHLRLEASRMILGRKFIKGAENISGEEMDLFLLPEDWKNNLEKFQRKLPHPDSKFMWNIAKDSKLLCQKELLV